MPRPDNAPDDAFQRYLSDVEQTPEWQDKQRRIADATTPRPMRPAALIACILILALGILGSLYASRRGMGWW